MPLEINNLVIKQKPKEVSSPHDKILKETKKSERLEPASSPAKWYTKRSEYLADMISKK